LINAVRNESEYTLVLDAGNALLKPADTRATRSGQVMIEAMNMMRYDAMAIGPQDVAMGAAALRERIAQAAFPLLSANLIVETGALFAEPYVLLPLAGHTVAIVGLTGSEGFPQTAPVAGQENLTLTDPLDAAREYVAAVSSQADIIILLSNAGLLVNQMIAQKLPDVDVIVTGGTGTLTAPIRYDEGHAVLAEAGYRGEWLGQMALEFDAGGKVISFQGEAVALTDEYADDPAMRQFVNRAKSQ